MKYLHRLQLLLSVICMIVLLSGTAQASLRAAGPNDPATGFPTWYQDNTDLAVQECLDLPSTTGGVPYCTLLANPGFDPALPIIALPTFANYPIEMFYWVADAKFNTVPNTPGAIAAFRIGLEGTFAFGTATPNSQITFLVVNLQKMTGLTPNSTYTVTHPFGSFIFTTDNAGVTVRGLGGQAFRIRDDTVPAPFAYTALLPAVFTNVGPFLRPSATPGGAATPLIVDPVSGHTFLANPLTPTAITGGTNGNVVTITGPNIGGPGVSTVTSSLWNIQGRVFTGAIARPLTIDRATYARDAVGGQIDMFVTAQTGATLTVTGTGIPLNTTMTADTVDPSKYFLHIPFTGTLPTGIQISNSLDLVTPIPHPVTPVDEIVISSAVYNPNTKIATVKATSRDTLALLPVLTGSQFAVPNTFTAGLLTQVLVGNPPQNVSVISSHGGSDIIPISVVAQVPPPVAVNDSASTAKGIAVSIDVIANDTSAGGTIDPTSVAIIAIPASGATVVPASNGSVLYTPPATFAGTETFAYTVKDILGQTSNVATVSVLVNSPPVAGNDTASAVINTTVNINVVANDTASNSIINPTTVNVVSPASCGTIAVLANGTVNFTAPAAVPAAPGTCSFSYVVSDTFIPPALSNVATVTVTITLPAPPVANNDTATTTTSTTAVINVIANDTTPASSTINPASVVVTAPTGGTAVANANGTVSYTAPAAPGTYSFTYTVKDNFGQASNAATVTVTVHAPPVAGNDTASVVINSTVNINVIANDVASSSLINATTVAIVSPATCGTAVALTNGTVNFTAPATVPAAPGTCSFSYTVSDTFVPSAVSNAATVTVTITPPTPPVAQNDAAAALSSATVVINVIANDTSSGSTINPASIVVTAPTGGTAVANINGTVSYTAPVAPGIYTFTYTVKDNNLPALTSNAATVTVTVTAPFVFPSAVNDSAVVPAGGSIVINVAANDVAGTNPLNPGSVAVVTAPAHGTATANLGGPGTVTYTPTAGFSGNDSFTYNIKDTLGNVSATSATVAISVTTPAPTETITVTRAQFTLSNASWRIDGSSNAPIAGQTMKIFNSATVPADGVTGLLAMVPVAGGGSFTWSSATGSLAPNALRKISILSSKNPNNNKLEQVTVTVR